MHICNIPLIGDRNFPLIWKYRFVLMAAKYRGYYRLSIVRKFYKNGRHNICPQNSNDVT